MMCSRITRQKVFKAAKVIALKGKEPTLADVRAYFAGCGSQTTIHKYLKEWKLKCFQASGVDSDFTTGEGVTELTAAKEALVLTVAKLQEQNQVISNELIKTERKNIELNHSVTQQAQQLQLLEKQYKEAEQRAQQLAELNQNIKAERDTALDKITKKQDKLIDSLREELKQSHQASLAQIKETSFNSHDVLMQEKVITINLQEQVKTLNAKVAELKQELDKAYHTVLPLRKEVERQRKFITEVVTFEQLQAYEKFKLAADFESNT